MAYQAVFKRYELKYLLTREQKARVLQAMEKPEYKEKLRVRSYSQVGPEGPVFVELKKKYQSVVYKRRISLPEQPAMAWMAGKKDGIPGTQIARELQYTMGFYGELTPKVFLSYEREAYYAKDGSEFRVTFDDHIVCRQEDLSLQSPAGGTPILEEGLVLMEVKYAGGMPMWLSLVRFRSAPGTAKEITMLFLAMTAGLMVGMGYLGYAILFTLILCGLVCLYNHLDLGTTKNAATYKVLNITIPEDLDYSGVFDELLDQYTTSYELARVKTTNMGSMFRLTYNVALKDVSKEKELIDALRCRNGNLEISVSKQETTSVEL